MARARAALEPARHSWCAGILNQETAPALSLPLHPVSFKTIDQDRPYTSMHMTLSPKYGTRPPTMEGVADACATDKS